MLFGLTIRLAFALTLGAIFICLVAAAIALWLIERS